MSLATITAAVDVREVDRAIDEMLDAGHKLGPAFRKAKPVMRLDQRDHAKKQMGPGGRWPARAKSTARKLRSKGKRPRLLGKLPISTTYVATKTGVRGLSRVSWSNAHNQGARVGRGSVLPKREYLWISDDLLTKVTAIFSEHIVEGR